MLCQGWRPRWSLLGCVRPAEGDVSGHRLEPALLPGHGRDALQQHRLLSFDGRRLDACRAQREQAGGRGIGGRWLLPGGQWTERCLRVRTLAEGTKLAREWIEERTRNTVFRATSETQALDAPPYGEGT